MMEGEFARAAYSEHHALFRHYSEQIFRTRISIITLLILFFGYAFGVVPLGQPLVNPTTTAMLAYLAAALLALLFSIEAQYYRRLVQVVIAGRHIEDHQNDRLYFHTIDRASHWELLLLYISGIIALTSVAAVNFVKTQHSFLSYSLAIALAPIPVLLASRTAWRFSTRTIRLLAASMPEIKERQDHGHLSGESGTAPNPVAAQDG